MRDIQRAAFCPCQTVFEYEERDKFDGELFCPSCMSRIKKKNRYSNLDQARTEHPRAKVYKEND